MIKRLLTKKRPQKGQLEFDLFIPKEKDRNHHLGGRSFYFFDFDDNVAYLSTPILIFNKKTGDEKYISSSEFALEGKYIGNSGKYKDYYVDLNDETGSFKFCRDQKFSLIDKVINKKQYFLKDIEEALQKEQKAWQAPCWSFFKYATYNKRPVSIITARGHNKSTIKRGIELFVDYGHLPYRPNFLSIYPVTNPLTRKALGDLSLQASVAELKRTAIRESVEKAFKKYGYTPHHRFGMSDDDPKNIDLITEEMKLLKRKYPENSFYVIHTHESGFTKREILQHRSKKELHTDDAKQLDLFTN